MTSALGQKNSKYANRTHESGNSVIVAGGSALPATATSGFTTSATEVALVDKIVFSGLTNDAATNQTITLTVNGEDLLFHFPGTANLRKTFRKEWKVHGNLVVNPSSALLAESTDAVNSSVEVHYRKISVQQAISDGFLSGGTMPNVASTNSVTGSGLVAGTAKEIVAGVAGMHIQVLGFCYTGHGYDAAEDSARIGFWDDSYQVLYDGAAVADPVVGETITFSGAGVATVKEVGVESATDGRIVFTMVSGTVPADDETYVCGTSGATGVVDGTPDGFSVVGRTIMKTFTMGADTRYAPDIWVGDTEGCIQGPVGESLYVDATTNLTTVYSVAYDNEGSGPFVVGNTLTFDGAGATAKLLTLVDNGDDGIITFVMKTGSPPAEDEGITSTGGATGDVAGTPAIVGQHGDYVVLYRLIDAADVADTSGRPGISTMGRRFWVYTEAEPLPSGDSIPWFAAVQVDYDTLAVSTFNLGERINWTGAGSPNTVLQRITVNNLSGTMTFGNFVGGSAIADGATCAGAVSSATAAADGASVAINLPDADIRILGQAASFTCVNEAVAPSTAAIGVGVASTSPVTAINIMNSDAAASPLEVSSSLSDDNLDVRVSESLTPCFTGTMLTAGGCNRSHLAWGRMDGDVATAAPYISRFV